LGEETMVVRQGSSILIPPGQVHRFWNPAATSATFLVYFTPAGAEAFFEVLSGREWEESHSPAALAEVWAMGVNFDYFLM
jgi:oxalate decarboxylase/phosphoglucose isomerase-like protein (cupin superfamily)